MKLTSYPKESLFRGTVFKFKYKYRSTYTKKKHVMMLCEYPYHNEDEAPFALYYVKGYYAGVQVLVFPKEALTKEPYTCAISRDWVIKNWKRFISDSNVKKVKIEEEQ